MDGAQQGIILTDETMRQWCLKFGQMYANELCHRRPRCGDKWHLDEVFLTIGGENDTHCTRKDRSGGSVMKINLSLLAGQIIFLFLVFALLLFLPAGTIAWSAAWTFLALFFVFVIAITNSTSDAFELPPSALP